LRKVIKSVTGSFYNYACWWLCPQTPKKLFHEKQTFIFDTERKESVMANRNRPYQIKFDVTEEEKALIDKRQEQSGITNKGAFYRKMLIDGIVVKTDMSALKDVTIAINRIGNNVNQIARRANQTGRVYEEDIKELDEKMGEIWQLLKSTLSNQL
jgi:hypothetical protein